MLRKLAVGASLCSGLLVASHSGATLINLTVNGGGMVTERTCMQASCLGVSGGQVWLNNVSYTATGTVTIDDVALTMSGALSVSFSEVTGAADNGITNLQFSNTTYTFTNQAIAITSGSTTNYDLTTAAHTAVVDPAALTEVGTGGGTTDPIFNTVMVTGGCGLVAGNTGQCGFTFGRSGFQAPAPLSRFVQQTFNVSVVPEPGTLALFGLGAGALVWVGRRRA